LAGSTPLSVWQSDEGDRVIELPAFPEQLETIVAVTATRTIFHYGIEFDNLRYNSAQLQSINHRVEENPVVAVRAHEHDVGYVHVMDPETEEFLKVPAVDQVYAAGVNRHVHLLVCAEARKRFGEGWRDEQLLEVKAEIQAIVEAAMRAKKTGTRKGAAKHNALDSESVLAPDLEALGEAMQPVGIGLPKPAVPADITANDDLPDLVTSAIS
jgi:putative transposase